jgi:hypothetical protein
MTNWAATVAAGLSLTLVIFNAVLVSDNQTSQSNVTQRQQTINQGSELVRVEQAMVRNAMAANNPKDDAYSQLLARYNIKPVAATMPATAPAPGAK